MTTQNALKIRLRIYLRRECYVWVCMYGQPGVSFGWILGYQIGNYIVFKDDERRGTMRVPVAVIESCGAV